MNLLVDPVVLAIPTEVGESKELLDYVQFINSWAIKVRANLQIFVIPQQCLLALFSTPDICPSWNTLLDRWKQEGLELSSIISVKDTFNAFAKLLNADMLEQLIPPIPEHKEIKGIELDPDLTGRLGIHQSYAWRQALGHVLFAKKVRSDAYAVTIGVFTHPCNGQTRASIRGILNETRKRETKLETELSLICHPTDLETGIQFRDIWPDLERCLDNATRTLVQSRSLALNQIRFSYRFSPYFASSIEQTKFATERRLRQIFSAIALLLAGVYEAAPDQNHNLEDSSTGKPRMYSPSGSSESWEAMRLDLTDSERIHYWQRGNKRIIDRVTIQHNDYHINLPKNVF